MVYNYDYGIFDKVDRQKRRLKEREQELENRREQNNKNNPIKRNNQ